MNGSAHWLGAWLPQPFIRLSGALLASGLLAFAMLASPALARPPLKNNLLAIGNCPPWNPQSVEVCKHSLEKVVSALSPRIDAGPDATHLLINEGANATALKLKATELANKLGKEDRLVIYANLPLAPAEETQQSETTGYALELWADEKPVSTNEAIAQGTWVSASAFAAMIHTIPAGEVILILDTNNSHAINMHLLEQHSVDLKERPEALISSAGQGQAANYSEDRTISLFAKHLAAALDETEGSLLDALTVAASGTRQAAIPICASLKEHNGQAQEKPADCTQVPEIHDPGDLLGRTVLAPLEVTELN